MSNLKPINLKDNNQKYKSEQFQSHQIMKKEQNIQQEKHMEMVC